MQCSDKGSFAKGLSVVDDVAYLGISPFAPRSARTDPALDCELAAFDLLQQRLLWRTRVSTPPRLRTRTLPMSACTGQRSSCLIAKQERAEQMS